MAKKHVSMRLDEELLQRADSYAEANGLSRYAAIGAAIEAGFDTLENADDEAGGDDAEPAEDAQEAPADTSPFATKALDALTAQLEAKDRQIAALTDQLGTAQRLAEQAQALHAMTEQKALAATTEDDEGGTKRRGFWARLFGLED